jgi:hypothetical protein
MRVYTGSVWIAVVDLAGDVTVTSLTADGLTVDSVTEATSPSILADDYNLALPVAGTSGYFGQNIGFYASGTNSVRASINSTDDGASGQAGLSLSTGNSTSTDVRLKIDYNGDISFYEDTGTTPKFFWDASTERLGIGNVAPATALDVTGTITADGLKIDSGVFDINLNGSLDALPADNDESHIFTTSGSGSGFFAKYGALGLSSRNRDTASSDIGFFTDKLLRVEIDDTGDISFYDDSGTSQNFYWDASTSRLGLGTTSPASPLQVNRASTDGAIVTFSKDGATVGFIGTNTGQIYIGRDDTGIRFTSGDDAILPVSANSGVLRSGAIDLGRSYSTFRNLYLSEGLRADTLKFSSLAGSEYGRFDSSGNLLVGTTVEFGNSGITLNNSGLLYVDRSGNKAAVFSRRTSDGAIVEFSKDFSTVGSIGVDLTDNIFLSGNSSHSGLMAGTESIVPYANGNISDASEDLGTTTARWRDLYLSGGVYLGGTGSANLLDDYEEGAWTPTLAFGGSSTGITYTSRDGHYIKIGKQVTLHGSIILSSKGSSTGAATVQSLPFTVGNNLSGTTLEAGGIVSYSEDFTGAVATGGISVSATDGTTELKLKELQQSGTTTNDLEEYNFQNTTTFRFSITYFT